MPKSSFFKAYVGPALTENVAVGFYFLMVTSFLASPTSIQLFDNLNQRYTKMELATSITFVLTTVFYWSYALLYFPIDLYHLLSNNKIQPNKHVDWQLHWKCIKGVIFNQIFVGIPEGYLFYLIWNEIESWSGNSILTNSSSFPRPSVMALHFLVFAIVEEIGFYYTHRLAHHPKLYAKIHKQHHIFTSPIAASAIFAHPIEHFVSNLAPVLSGPLMVSLIHYLYPSFPTVHLVTVWTWMILAQFTTITTHSGYRLWGMPDSRKHDFHHEKFNVNYGVLGILDYLHSTDSLWLEKLSGGKKD